MNNNFVVAAELPTLTVVDVRMNEMFPDCFQCKGLQLVRYVQDGKCKRIHGGSGFYEPALTMFDDTENVRVDLTNGTLPLADLFWYCGSSLLSTLPANWTSGCAPVKLL